MTVTHDVVENIRCSMDDEQFKKLKPKEIEQRIDAAFGDWLSDDRDVQPIDFRGQLTVRKELINAASIKTFLQRTAARRAISANRGPLVQAFHYILRRAEACNDMTGDWAYIRVVNQRVHTGLRTAEGEDLMTRSFSGVNKLPTVPDAMIREALNSELQIGIPRTHMGKSTFAYGTIVKTVCRHGLHTVDGDQVKCFIQSRFNALPDEMKAKMNTYRDYLENSKTINAHFTKLVPKEVVVKKYFIAASNMGGYDSGCSKFDDWLDGIRADTDLVINFEWARNPQLHNNCMTQPKPKLNLLAKLDWHREYLVTSQMDNKLCSNEWDGVVQFCASEAGCLLAFKRMQIQAGSVAISRKLMDDPLEIAAKKYPELDWTHVNKTGSMQFLAELTRCYDAIDSGVESVRLIDAVFGDVVRGINHMHVMKARDGTFEIFRNGLWEEGCKAEDVLDLVVSDLHALFGKFRTVDYQDLLHKVVKETVPKMVPPPLDQDAFRTKVAICFLKYARHAINKKLDFDLWGKILGPDGIMYDYDKQEFRQARPEDRLLRTTAEPLHEWDAPEDLKTNIIKFSELLKVFFMKGGKTLDTELDEDGGVATVDIKALVSVGGEIRRLRLELRNLFAIIYDHPRSHQLRGMCKVLADDFADPKSRRIDEVCYFLRQDARTVASMPGLCGMLNLTGPKSGGKSYLAGRQFAFLGLENENYGKMTSGNYLTTKPPADPEKSRPVKNQFQGKKGIYFKEMPAQPLIPETVKDLLDPKDGHTEGRANNSQKKDQTSFPITFVLFAMSNTPVVVYKHGTEDTGMGGKLGEIQTQFELSDQPNVANPRQRQGDNDFATETMMNKHGDEFFFWARAMHKTITTDVCKGRHIVPEPASLKSHEEESMGETTDVLLRTWMQKNLQVCTALEATPWTTVMELIFEAFGKVSKHVLVVCGVSEKFKGQYRPKSPAPSHDFLKYFCTTTNKLVPVKYILNKTEAKYSYPEPPKKQFEIEPVYDDDD